MLNVLEIVLMITAPALILWLTKKVRFLNSIGAISLCYLLGFALALLPIPYDKTLSQDVASVFIALAIPLVLFGFDVLSVRRLAWKTVAAFGLMILSVLIVSTAVGVIADAAGFSLASEYAGMTTGLYIGGTPNLFAIGYALLEDSTYINIANVADSLIGGVYFLLVLTVIRTLYRRFLKGGKNDAGSMRGGVALETVPEEYDYASIPRDKRSILKLAGVVLLAVACLGVGAGLEILINGDMSGSLYIMIAVSVLGVAVSFVKPVRRVKGSYQIGQYLILVFSLGLSMSIDVGKLVSDILPTFAFFACVQLGAALLHFFLCKIFRIGGGIALVTSIAGIYGPPFIAPTANAYGDRDLIAPGVICGTLGLVVGNLLGIGLGSLLAVLL